MQVGAFDGTSGDPVRPLVEKHGLRGVLLEPQREAFDKLCQNYSQFGGRFKLVNAAIGPFDGEKPLYRIRKDAHGPEWLPQLASFDRKTITKHRRSVPDIESLIEVEQVSCITFPSLFQTLGNPRVDFLQIDAEGYDAEILRLFDLQSHMPAIVHFEHKHLSRKEHEAAIRNLINLGYKIAILGENTLAYWKR